MWSNYILTSFRSLQRNKFFVGINLVSIAIAFALCTIAWFNLQFNGDFNRAFANADIIYKVNAEKITANGQQLMGTTPLPLAAALITDLDGVTATSYVRENQLVKVGDQLFRESVGFADDNFFSLFDFPLVSGGKASWQQQTDIFIDEDLAVKLFGEEAALGQSLEFVHADGTKQPVTIAGVLKDLPENTSFVHSIVAPMHQYVSKHELKENDWTQWVDATFYKTERDAKAVDALLAQYLAAQNEVNEGLQVAEYRSASLLDWPEFENRMLNSSFMGHLHPASVMGTVSSAITVLLLACFNFINTSIAISRNRLKEIGVRKVLGGVKGNLRAQFLVESLVQILIALALSGIVTMLLIDPYNAMFEYQIVEFDRISLLPFFGLAAGIWLLTGLLAGMYPALYISKFKPVEIFRNKIRFSRKNLFTKSLLTFQFMVCVYNIFSLILFTQNTQYQETLDRGYAVNSSINIPVTGMEQFKPLAASLEQMPEVVSVKGTVNPIGFSINSIAIQHLGEDYDVASIKVGSGYLEALQVRLAEGRFFPDNEEASQKYVLVNQMMEESVEGSLLNQRLSWQGERYTVIGLVEDFNLRPIMLDNKIRPTVIFFAPEEEYRYANVVVNSEPLEADKSMQEAWAGLFPDELYLGFMQEDVMKAVRQTNHIMLSINGVVAVITLLISALGLYALVYMNIQSRIKEFGVRKVLGASVKHILYLLNRQILIMMVIAAVLGLVAGKLVISQILDIVYAYHKDIELNNYIWPVVVVFSIVGLSIGFKVWQSAKENPVKQLRAE